MPLSPFFSSRVTDHDFESWTGRASQTPQPAWHFAWADFSPSSLQGVRIRPFVIPSRLEARMSIPCDVAPKPSGGGLNFPGLLPCMEDVTENIQTLSLPISPLQPVLVGSGCSPNYWNRPVFDDQSLASWDGSRCADDCVGCFGITE